MNQVFRNHRGLNKKTPVTWTLIGINCLVFLLQQTNNIKQSNQYAAGNNLSTRDNLSSSYIDVDNAEINRNTAPNIFQKVLSKSSLENMELVPSEVYHDPQQYWTRIVSSTFAHAGWEHILYNMVALYLFGVPLENRIGSWKTLLIYMLGGIGSNILYTLTHKDSDIGLVGASAAISAISAAYFLEYQDTRSMVDFVLIQLFGMFLSAQTGVSYISHIYGFVFGTILYFLLTNTQQKATQK